MHLKVLNLKNVRWELGASAGHYKNEVTALPNDNRSFESNFYGGNGSTILEIITYHALALGFIASTFKSSEGKMTKQRTIEIFNTGVTTVSSYLLQGIFGLAISLIAALVLDDFFEAALRRSYQES